MIEKTKTDFMNLQFNLNDNLSIKHKNAILHMIASLEESVLSSIYKGTLKDAISQTEIAEINKNCLVNKDILLCYCAVI